MTDKTEALTGKQMMAREAEILDALIANHNRLAAENEQLRQAIEQAQQAEPYGYLKLNTGRFVNEVEGLNPMTDKRYLPLYTSPPPRRPLTEEEIAELCRSLPSTQYTTAFARAIKAAHGIKGEA